MGKKKSRQKVKSNETNNVEYIIKINFLGGWFPYVRHIDTKLAIHPDEDTLELIEGAGSQEEAMCILESWLVSRDLITKDKRTIKRSNKDDKTPNLPSKKRPK